MQINKIKSIDKIGELTQRCVKEKAGLISDLKLKHDAELVDSFIKTGRIEAKSEKWKISKYLEKLYREPTSDEKQQGQLLTKLGI